MQIKITYSELSSIFNHYVAVPSESEKMKYTFLPTDNGISIKFDRLKWHMLNFKKEVQAELINFQNGELEIKIEINGVLLDLLKKFIIQMLYKTLKYKFKGEEIKLSEYLYVSKSRVYIQLNRLLQLMETPVELQSMESGKNDLSLKMHIL